MSDLSITSLFRQKVSKLKDPRMNQESQPDLSYPTGFLSFDYMNGTVIHVKKDGMKFTYNDIGIVDGSLVTVIGRSGCGKTTWIMQAASNIIRPFKSSCIYHDDIEGGIVDSRKSVLLKMCGEELQSKYIARNTGITAENFYERIKIVHDLKMENYDELLYDTGKYTDKGEKIYKLEPTVYILDSIAMLMPEKVTEEEELSGQMSVTSAAKTNTTVFKRIVPLLKRANIILFIVNHITESVEINAFSKQQGQLSYLKPGERLGGGRAPIYVSNLIVRLDDHSKLKSDEGLGIDGTLVDFSILKSRTTNSGNKITLVFDYHSGFDQELSLLYFLKTMKLVNGAGAYLYIGDRSDIKFSQKQFKKKLREDTEFQKIVTSYTIEALQSIIYDAGEVEEYHNDGSFDITESILSQIAA